VLPPPKKKKKKKNCATLTATRQPPHGWCFSPPDFLPRQSPVNHNITKSITIAIAGNRLQPPPKSLKQAGSISLELGDYAR